MAINLERYYADDENEENENYEEYEDFSEHFEEYTGTYAQDVMGFSDEAIDIAFDGDPDACWNVD